MSRDQQGRFLPRLSPQKDEGDEQPVGAQEAPVLPSSLAPPPKRTLAMTRATIVANATVRSVCLVLTSGAHFQNHPHVNFALHTSQLIRMRDAYEREDEESFLALLEEYLKEAALHLPSAGRPGDAPEMISHLRRLMHEEAPQGFHEVARYLLARAAAPVDSSVGY